MKNKKHESGERGHRDHTAGHGNKDGRQGGGSGEHQSRAGEMGAKAEEPNNSTRLHTKAGDVHGHGTLKEGSRRDQSDEDRFGLHLGDDYRVSHLTGEQNENVRRQTGISNHEGGKMDGTGGGKSSGGAGHGSQPHKHAPTSYNDPHRGNNQNAWVNTNKGSSKGSSGGKVNAKNYKGYEGGTPSGKLKSGGNHQHGGEFPPRTRQNPNEEGSSAGSH